MHVTASKILGMDTGAAFILVVCALFAYATGRTAREKGYSYRGFALLGFVLPIVGLIVALVLPDKTPTTEASADALLKFKQLLDAGVITQEEFDAKKRELLS